MTEQIPRIAPLEPPYDAETQQMLERWMPPGSAVEPLRLFRTLLHHEQLMGRMRPLGSGILGGRAEVPAPLREVMIHRTCALTGAEYEWGVHAVAFGAPLGLSPEQLHSTVRGAWSDPCWDARQAIVMRLAEELHRSATVSDQLWEQLCGEFSEAQVIELIVTAGWYHVIGYLCNALRIAPEDWAAHFPADGETAASI